jgi:hypothetical protein
MVVRVIIREERKKKIILLWIDVCVIGKRISMEKVIVNAIIYSKRNKMFWICMINLIIVDLVIMKVNGLSFRGYSLLFVPYFKNFSLLNIIINSIFLIISLLLILNLLNYITLIKFVILHSIVY